ncbi:hypothetical protein [Alkalilimnicola sp. S0819]|uniref:hypothetical protein n=1 Tax=Alkalilimnicola sp. S0819 TaxID=2613922 RepID=UPI001261E51D|nr:hypothetical protein [Alkalilimnicola sp. S0819]KAB7627286.1 hypothetical protein F3N43_05060 [Alkalilimnicola sp. S0819]MPQ15999.1 hypothetical protein [Alkalilimnicola sp. S0819]
MNPVSPAPRPQAEYLGPQSPLRLSRYHPDDRRRRQLPVLLDLRGARERRRRERRAERSLGRRLRGEPPPGVEAWA